MAASGVAKLLVQIQGDARSAVSAFQDTAKAAGKTGISLGTVAKVAAGAYATKKVLDFGRASVDAAGQAKHANKVLEASFRNAGDAHGEAAKAAETYADALARQIGVSPNVIKQSQAILASFHAVSDQTALQAGIFDRATVAAADLAAAGFGTLETNALKLGKALQDPTKYSNALARSGVVLTKAQKDQIAALQKSGNLLGAQKVLLAQVESQVKGTAASTAGAGAKMDVAYEQMTAAIGQSFLPYVSKAKGALANLYGYVADNASWLTPVIGGVAALAPVLSTGAQAVSTYGEAVQFLGPILKAAKVQVLALNAAVMANPWILIVVAIVAVIAALVLLYLKCAWFRNFVNGFMGAVVGVFTAGWRAVTATFTGVVAFLRRWGPLMVAGMFGPFGLAFLAIQKFVPGGIGRLVSEFLGVPSKIRNALSGVTAAIIAPFRAAFDAIKSKVIDPLVNTWNRFAKELNAVHVSFTVPSNAVTKALKIADKGFSWQPPFRLPVLQQGGIITRTGLVYAHAGEAITPAPPNGAARGGPLVRIDHAHFSERIDLDVFGRRLAWAVKTAGA